MTQGKQLKGKCAYCGQEIAKNQTAKHLVVCAQRQATITKAGKLGDVSGIFTEA